MHAVFLLFGLVEAQKLLISKYPPGKQLNRLYTDMQEALGTCNSIHQPVKFVNYDRHLLSLLFFLSVFFF